MGDIKQRQDLCLPPDTVWNLARLTQNKLTSWSVREGQSRASITLTFDKSKANQYFPTSTETQSKGRQTTEISSQRETRKLGKRKKVSDTIQDITKCASSQSPPGEVIVIDSDDPLIGNGLCPDVQHQPDGDVIVLDVDVQQTTDHVIIIDDECTVKCDKEATRTTSVLSLVTKDKTEHKHDETPKQPQLRIASDRISSTGDVITPKAVSEAIKTEQHKPVFPTISLLSSETRDKAAGVAEVSDVHVDGKDTDTLDTTIAQSVCVDKKKYQTPEISSTGDIIPSEQPSAFLSGGVLFVAVEADTLAQNVREDKKPNTSPERPQLRITSDWVTSTEDAITSEVVSESINTEEHKPVFSCTNTTSPFIKSESAPEKTLTLKRSVPLNRPTTATKDSQPAHSGDAETPGCSESKKLRSEQEAGVPTHIKPSAAVPESFLVCLTAGDCLTYIDSELITASFHKVSSRCGKGTYRILKKRIEFYVRAKNKVNRKGKQTKISDITIDWIRENRQAMSDGFRQHLFLKVLQKTMKPRKKRHIISAKDRRQYYQLYTYKRPTTFPDCPTVDDCLAFIDAELVDTRFHLSSCYGEGTYTIYDNKEEFYVHDNRRENGGMKRTHIPDITLDWIRNNKEVLACGFRRHLFLKVLQKSLKHLNGSDRISEKDRSEYNELYNYKRPI